MNRTTSVKVVGLLRQLRPLQWIKNFFVFVGVLFSNSTTNPELLHKSIAVFLQFCFASSLVYTFNDLNDIEEDRNHPTKKKRPLSAGHISARDAYYLMAFLVGMIAFLVPKSGTNALFFVGTYLVLNYFYSIDLKKRALLDIFCIAAGFMLRILSGSYGIGIEASSWMLLTGMMISLFFGFSKRLSELLNTKKEESRKVLELYSREALSSYVTITATASILTYGLYTLDANTIQIHHTKSLVWTLPFVIYGIFRYIHLLYQGKGVGENTSKDIFSDTGLIVCSMLWALSIFLILR